MGQSVQLNTQVFPDVAALSHAVAEKSLQIANLAISGQGRCAIALAGGHTPASVYALWAEKYRDAMPWTGVHLFWSDERYVPADNPLSNYRMVRENLLARVPLPEANVHPMPTHFEEPEEAAKAYEAALRKFFHAAPPAFDLQFLGVGPEGHTASLFPESPALEEAQRWVIPVRVPADPPLRLTMTLPVLNQARNTFFLVTGAGKRPIINVLRNASDFEAQRYPAARIRPAGRVVWFLDQSANS